MDHITICFVVHNDDSKDSFSPTLQFPAATQSILAAFRVLFWSSALQMVNSHSSHQPYFYQQKATFLMRSFNKYSLAYLPSTKELLHCFI